jgi:hypothetical protein
VQEGLELSVHVVIFPQTMFRFQSYSLLGFVVVLAYLGALANEFITPLVRNEEINIMGC